jgi:RyR domain
VAYDPQPLETRGVELPAEIAPLVERLAEHNHDIWARQRLADGWTLGPQRDDARKKHPCLVPYSQLPESEKAYDRNAALETLKAIITLGYAIQANRGS